MSRPSATGGPQTLRALALVLLAPLALAVLTAALTFEALAARSQAAALQDRLARAVARPLGDPVLQGQALLVPGDSPGLAASAFQAAVRAAALAAGSEVLQVESAPVEAAPPLARLSLTLRLRGSEAQIVATLAALEAATPLVRIDRLDLQGEGQEGGPLTATLLLSAWSAEVKP